MNQRKFWAGLAIQGINLFGVFIYLLWPSIKTISLGWVLAGMVYLAFNIVSIALLVSGISEKEK